MVAKKDSDLETFRRRLRSPNLAAFFKKERSLVIVFAGLLVLVLLFVLASYWFHLMIEGSTSWRPVF